MTFKKHKEKGNMFVWLSVRFFLLLRFIQKSIDHFFYELLLSHPLIPFNFAKNAPQLYENLLLDKHVRNTNVPFTLFIIHSTTSGLQTKFSSLTQAQLKILATRETKLFEVYKYVNRL